MINNWVGMGRLTATPELKTTNGGVEVTSFQVAIDRDYTPKGKEKETDFITVVAWNKTASFVTSYFSKGDMIAIIGSLQSRKFTDKNGVDKTVWEIKAEKVSFCGKKADTTSIPYNEPNGEYAPVEVPAENEEELPF